jgi:hypothetical protein
MATNLLDLPHALLENISTELTLPGVGRYASVCSLLRQLIAANAAPCWRVHLDACTCNMDACTCNVASDQPRLTLRALTTLDAARWADISPRFAESKSPYTRLVFSDGQPNAQVAHNAFTCNDGKTLVIVGVMPHSSVLSAWAIDITAQPARWQQVAASCTLHGLPAARRFTADGGGGGVLRDKAGREWLCLFGGLIVDQNGRAHHRDNQTWLLGPLGAATGCEEWRWWQVQADGGAQSDERPTTRFHHSQTVLTGGADRCGRLAICGGCDYTMSPLLEVATLSLQEEDLAPPADGAPGPPPALSEVVWEFIHEGDAEQPGMLPSPGPLERHAAASWDGHGLLIIGGEDVENDILPAVWLHQTQGHGAWANWVQLPDLPHERSRAAAVVVKGEQLVVCGGMGGGDPTAVWVLSLLPHFFLHERPPSGVRWSELLLRQGLEGPRLDATLCVVHGEILVLGGGHSGEQLDHFGDAAGSRRCTHRPVGQTGLWTTSRLASLGPPLSETVTALLVFCAGAFWAEGETCAWRLLPSESGGRVARSRMCGAGLLLEPIKEADPARDVLSLRTKRDLLEQLQTHVRLVDSGDVRMRLGSQLSVNAPYEVTIRPMPSTTYEASYAELEHLSVQVPLANVRPRFLPANRSRAGILPLGRVTVAACPTGVIVVRGWKDGGREAMMMVGDDGFDGMSARRLSFLP